MIRNGNAYAADFILKEFIPDCSEKYGRKSRKRLMLGNDLVNCDSLRLRCFKVKGLMCVTCGIVGEVFHKEKALKSDPFYHINLYAIKHGKEVLMTRDHIVPLSKGGPDILDNLQTMCTACNYEKGNKLDVRQGILEAS